MSPEVERKFADLQSHIHGINTCHRLNCLLKDAIDQHKSRRDRHNLFIALQQSVRVTETKLITCANHGNDVIC